MAEQATHGFTRRSFIKGAAALTATGALVGCSPQTQNLEKAEPQREPPRRKSSPVPAAPNAARAAIWMSMFATGRSSAPRRAISRTARNSTASAPRGSRSLRAYTALSVCNIPCVASANVARESSSVSPGTRPSPKSPISGSSTLTSLVPRPLRSSWVVATPPNLAEEPGRLRHGASAQCHGGEPCSAGPRYRHAHVLDLHVRPRLGRKPCFGRSQR